MPSSKRAGLTAGRPPFVKGEIPSFPPLLKGENKKRGIYPALNKDKVSKFFGSKEFCL